MAKLVTLEEARHRLRRAGVTGPELARSLHVSTRTVRLVLSGHLKGHRGEAHRVAVELGLKDGVSGGGLSPIEAYRLAGAR